MANQSHCPYCGTTVSPTARYCDNCGTPLVQTDSLGRTRREQPRGLAPWLFALLLVLVFTSSAAAGYRYHSGYWPWSPAEAPVPEGWEEPPESIPQPPDSVTDPALARYARALVTLNVRGEQGSKTGSGFILDDRGHVVTSAHVITGYRNCVNVIDHNGTPHQGAVISWDSNLDVAMIYVPTLGEWPDRLSLRESPLAPGEQLYVLSSPGGVPGATLLPAQVTSTGVVKRIDGRYYPSLIEFQGAHVEHGASGSPLIHQATGEVVGIVTAAAETSVAWAVPIDESVRDLLANWSARTVSMQCRSFATDQYTELALATITPLSGRHGVWGNDLASGAALALRDMEADLRRVGYEVSLLQLDDQGETAAALEQADTVAFDQQVIGVVGSFTSQVTAAIAERLKETGLVIIAPTVGAEELTAQGWPHFNRLVASTARLDAAAATFAKDRLGGARVLIAVDGTAAADRRAQSFETSAQIIALPVIGRLELTSPLNPEAVVREVMTASANVIYYAGAGELGFQLASALRERGIMTPVIGGTNLYDPAFEEFVGPTARGVYFTHFSSGADERFERHFAYVLGKPTRGYGQFGYDAARVILEALVQYGEQHPGQTPDRAELAALVRQTRDLPGWTGSITIDPTNGENMAAPVHIFEWVGGRYEPRE